ncbi:MAG TPA: glycosyltransferase, partial [Gemmatimonadaceae bacterium]|nr:glycosyltransferase [Gemmatimonadaceae bacterium]
QTYPHWELLLCDDGSADGSRALAERYAASDPGRIRVLAHPGGERRGASAARNLGLRAARGAYVAFLDADDVWLAHKLAEQVALLERTPEAEVLVGSTEFWYGWSGEPADAQRDHVVGLGLPHGTVLPAPDLLTRMLDGSVPVPCTCSLIARRAAVERAGGFEESFRRVFTDQAFYAKLFLRSSVLVVETCWDRYRRHEASSCASAERDGELATARVAYLEWLRGYVDASGTRDRRVRRAVRDALRRARGPGEAPAATRLRRRLRRVLRAAGGGVRRALRVGEPVLGGGTPAPGTVVFGSLRRTAPINRHWGWERGQPVDRHYIEAFLAAHAADVRGRVLEVGDDSYTRRFGGERVTRRDVLHAYEGNPIATFVADLADADHLPSDTFDCVILTQTLHLVFDVHAAMRTLHRILAPGGTLLLTVPGISQTTDDSWRTSWYWSFTTYSLERLARGSFPADAVTVRSHGNVLTAVAFLHGLARQELRPDELAVTDPDFPLVVTLRAVKSA